MIVALINNKGGVAKTTTAVNIAAGLCGKGSRVLLVDLDSQAAASLSLRVRRADLRPSIADVLLHAKPPREVIRKTTLENLDLFTGSNELAAVDSQLATDPERDFRVRRVLDEVYDDYAHIVIDCPPSLSALSVNALVASDYYIVPVTPSFLTLGGLASLVEEVNALHKRLDGDVAGLLGFVLTMVDYRNGTTQKLVESVRAGWKDLVFKTEIRVNVKLSEAPSVGKTIFQHAPTSSGAKAYRDLCKELLRREKELESPEPSPVEGANPTAETVPSSTEAAPQAPASESPTPQVSAT
ncbi:MAG TPA: ParA family protein [Planctomycetota bacterium]|nr:ParA family protein [Planctomycetota bacterium]